MTYTFISDIGHGWLAVPLKDYLLSGIAASPFSYRDNLQVYLEEDWDAGLFMAAMNIDKSSIAFKTVEGLSPIRNKQRLGA